MKKQTLWAGNFRLLIFASTLGAAGGIAGDYALNFLVFDETQSTLASALLIALQIFPRFFLPVLAAPLLDRLPRKPFLVGGDLLGGMLYLLAGLYLKHFSFHYVGYLGFSLLISSIGALDSLAFQSIFPLTIPKGQEQQGYAVAGMLYPVLNVVMMPLAGVLLDLVGVGNLLMFQGICTMGAGAMECRMTVPEMPHKPQKPSGIDLWWEDFRDGFRYLKGERGLMALFSYMAVTNGVAMGVGPLMVAFFRTAPGVSAAMYAFFSVAEFLGRSLGGVFQYRVCIKKERRLPFTIGVYLIYDVMDMILLWLPYPAMLLNRFFCGFLGMNSATLREAAVQSYLPDAYRSRVNAFQNGIISAAGSVLALIVGAIGEWMDVRLAVSLSATLCVLALMLTVLRRKEDVRRVYEFERQNG